MGVLVVKRSFQWYIVPLGNQLLTDILLQVVQIIDGVKSGHFCFLCESILKNIEMPIINDGYSYRPVLTMRLCVMATLSGFMG